MPEKPKIQINQKPEWYVMGTDGVTYGPYEISQITDYIKQGRITSETRVQHPSHTNNIWEGASNVPVLSQLFRNASPPKQSLDLSQVRSKAASKGDATGRLVDVFDISFKRFTTPLVVKILWVLFLILWGLECVFVAPLYMSAWVSSLGNSLFEEPKEVPAMLTAYSVLAIPYLIYKVLSLLILRLICEGIIIVFDIRNQLILLRESR
ncbi:DUF4282 domain-containing protein [Pirellulaceae bacterium SH449]